MHYNLKKTAFVIKYGVVTKLNLIKVSYSICNSNPTNVKNLVAVDFTYNFRTQCHKREAFNLLPPASVKS